MGIGAQRCGTSWWYRLLLLHPDVALAPSGRKETHFLDQFGEKDFETGDIARYASLFPRPKGGCVGEWTPRYMLDPWVPGLIARLAPDTRIIAILRDPVERYSSGLTHSLTAGAPVGEAVVIDALERGFYFRQLEAFLDHFDRDRILVLQFERCKADPAQHLNDTYRFLGLDPIGIATSALVGVVNKARTQKVRVVPEVRTLLAGVYQEDSRELADAFPSIDLSLWTSPERPGR